MLTLAHLALEDCFFSTRYVVIGEPPSVSGAFHDSDAAVELTSLAWSRVGGPGTPEIGHTIVKMRRQLDSTGNRMSNEFLMGLNETENQRSLNCRLSFLFCICF